MDNQLLDAICERWVPSLVCEDGPINEMLFIICGDLESSTTNGDRSGFFHSIKLESGDFCGKELLTWALMPNLSFNFPSSTRTIRVLTEVEAFALRAEDLKFVANQFKRLHCKKLKYAFRFYSEQWRMWGACFIQVVWQRYTKRKRAKELIVQEYLYYKEAIEDELGDEHDGTLLLHGYGAGSEPSAKEAKSGGNFQYLGVTILASKFAKNIKKGANEKVSQQLS